jgi:iron complex outermembrane recepter protein
MKSINIFLLPGVIIFSSSSYAQTLEINDGFTLDEVVVTAQKRAELDKEVPLSIAVLSGKNLDSLFTAGDDIQALSGHVPGLYIESSNGRIAPRFYLRGLGNVDFDLAASQSVSVIYDDVVQENVILKGFPLFDIENLEVARGPQGTLFGRNTTAGIVKFTSKKPTAKTEALLHLSYGTYNSTNVESALGGTVIEDKLLGRLSVLTQYRSDWIDNDFTGAANALGGVREYAGRLQLLYLPADNISALLNYHQRYLNGTQTPFRANVFTTGSNKLNENYDRDSVFYDGGNNNTQQYNGSGGSINININFDNAILTAISARENADGKNTGDIDGGVAGIGPGFIPFSSATVDAGNVDQVTHEVRLASSNNNFWNWLVGGFYFDSDLSVFTDAGFNSAKVYHYNESTALFAHNSFQINQLVIGAGLRFTNDDKKFHVNGITPIAVSAEKFSWDFSANYLWSESTSVFARVADGFRAPSIQGRNVAFLGQPSVAKSEDILSFEVGIKTDLLNEKLRINAAVFNYTIENFQLSAIGGSSNSNELLNAEKGQGKGFEADIEVIPTSNIKITMGYSYNHTEIRDENLFTAVCGSMQCTVTDPINDQGFANIHGNPFPGAPKTSLNLTFLYKIPYKSGNWFLLTDWVYQDDINLALYESKEFRTERQYEGGLRIGYENLIRQYEFSAFARNLTDEDNVKGFVDFNNNTGFVNEPRIVGIELRMSL